MTSDRPNQKIDLQLNPDGIAAPAQLAAVICREVVDLYFSALNSVDLSKKPTGPISPDGLLRFDPTSQQFNAEERRAIHETWILSKVFQDLMRGVRASLEEAYFFTELAATGKMVAKSSATLGEILAPFRKKAEDMKFPALLATVNKRLDKPLEFSEAYRSMQAARNCLEHRNGIVGSADVVDGIMALRFPRMIFFVERNGDRVELQQGSRVEAGEWLLATLEIRKREFRLGERLTLSASDLEEISFACYHFADDLARNLPKATATQTAASRP